MKPINNRKAFSMIELLFVIVIMGIVGGVALEAVREYYNGIYRTGIYTKRIAEADYILEQISKYFENGVSDSIIRLDENDATGCYGVPATGDDAKDYTIAFVAVDSDGAQGGYWSPTHSRWLPAWTSDVVSNGTALTSLDANYTAINTVANPLTAQNAAIFRREGLGEGADECHRFGWNSGGNTNNVYRTINAVVSDTELTLNNPLSLTGGQVSRAYVLRTAYAFRAKGGAFKMYSGFKPWKNERYTDLNVIAHLLADKVTHFTILYDNTNTNINSNVGNIYTLKICMQGVDENLSDSTHSKDQICRERMVHVRY
ncbi:type II secretion system protein [Sulfuricurvum sp.]|uniref:type II secretion system protein n=1 Tax=Sulfuricurvum sp. TaxID=2025608 RepID=UPI002E32E16C|nr:type II secretion system protein [Sulfuricurvum sp.]HEX5329285.1 type II secretion system protein [Sulfuricurvum sp.]